MKIFAISVLGLLVVLAVAGCNPVGMDKTRVYVTGLIYTDSTETIRAEGIGLSTKGTQETYVTETDANGQFWIEIQFYPEVVEGSTVRGGSSGIVIFSLKAFDTFAGEYFYGGDEDYTFTVSGGDTLTMYSINLGMFEAAKSGGR
ncbi:MAG: hypothetical protein GQ565_02690 [Candidatus Aegiribacteria sp.]|nr:hypothetical protein [Candidatus Aegiribacteria sp.]